MYYFVKVNIPKDGQVAGRLPWMPTLILFESDQSLKGIGVFSEWTKAEDFRAMLGSMFSGNFEMETVTLGEKGMPLSEFTEGVVNAVRSMYKAMVDTPVYVDPPDPFCKGLDVSYNNIQRFMRRAMREELEAMCDHLGFEQYSGFTIATHKRKVDDFYGCTAFRGAFTDSETMATAIEDARGTTLEKYHISTEFYPLVETAEMMAKKAVDEFSTPDTKKKIIV